MIAKKPHRHMIEINQHNHDADGSLQVVRLELGDDAGAAIGLFTKLKYAVTGDNHRGHANLFAVVYLPEGERPDGEREMHVILDQHSWERE
jgi:hypothetical protein